MKKFQPFILSSITGLLLMAAWPVSPLTPLIFVAWIPLLFLGEQAARVPFYLYSYLALLIWNAGTTWWIWHATAGGAIGAIVLNTWLMCLPLWGYHIIKNKFGSVVGYTSLVVFWLSFEYIHLNWQLSWPWLTLGNVFATHPEWVQWYEYTGSSGGSLWVMLVNVLLFLVIKSVYKSKSENPGLKDALRAGKQQLQLITSSVIFLVVPFIISMRISAAYEDQVNITQGARPDNVIIVQPNIDPYNEKFANGSAEGQISKLIALSEKDLDANTRLVVWPETAVPVSVAENAVQSNVLFQPIFEFTRRHPQVTLITGIESYRNYGQKRETQTARKMGDEFYDFFNASVAIKSSDSLQFYNKSKLVPGVETLPDFLLWLGPLFEKFGGTTGGYGHDKETAVFKTTGNPYVAAPIICYESVYGEYVAGYVRKGATILTIITNDGWWLNTPGHRQHLQYARLRAIETRRWVARSANTGISAVINDKGDLLVTKPWDQSASIKFDIPALKGETFFVVHGDLISRLMLVLMGIILLWHWFTALRARFNRRNNSGKETIR